MRKSITLLFLCFSFFFVRAQFGPTFYVDTLVNEVVSQLACADFNKDGMNDILTSNLRWPKDNMKLYLGQGNQVFSFQPIPEADGLTDLESFDVGDINHDTWPDFVIASEAPYEITWYENDEGTFIPHLVDDSLDFTIQVLLGDFDHNGFLDILSLQHTEIVLYLAIDEGVFGPARVIHSGTEFYAIDAAHYNQDTFLDVSVASDGFEVLLNDGSGHFTLHSQQGLGLDFALQSGDLDNDEDVDIAVYRTLSGILFYANNGDGNFSLQDTLIRSTDIFRSYVLEDLNCDGALDVFTSIPQQGYIVWIPNFGNGDFRPPHLIFEQFGELVGAVTSGDLNADEKPDILWGNIHLGGKLNPCLDVAVDQPEDKGSAVRIFPNPTTDFVSIENRTKTGLRVTIYDQLGRVIYAGQNLSSLGISTITLISSGLYFIQGLDHTGRIVFNQKVIRQ
jgi:Secretion system C-terminal sorting domain/FG-GAP-like repeat